jgi:hypothetical protein
MRTPCIGAVIYAQAPLERERELTDRLHGVGFGRGVE